MESEGSLPSTQEPTTGPYPGPDAFQQIHSIPRPYITLCNKLFFLRLGCVSSSPNPQRGEPPLLAVRDCLLNVVATALHIWRPSPSPATRGRAMPWWQDPLGIE